MITENELHVFVESTANYFSTVSGEPAEVGEPCVIVSDLALLDVTGILKVEGACSGFVFLTLSWKLGRALLSALEEEDDSKETLIDLVKEVSHNIAGNARERLNKHFDISVPEETDPDEIQNMKMPQLKFVVPITWNSSTAYLFLALGKA
ncbi:MAG: chemotaxis protein CheX [Verrucomicrobiota bacterium]